MAETVSAVHQLLRSTSGHLGGNQVDHTTLLRVIRSEDEKKIAHKLAGEEAKSFMDILKKALDAICIEPKHALTQRRSDIRRLLINVSKDSGEFPNGLCQNKSILPSVPKLPLYTAGNSDVYCIKRGDSLVCVKWLRSATAPKGNIKRNLCREALTCWTLRHKHLLPLLGVETPEDRMLWLISPWMKHGHIVNFQMEQIRNANAGPLISSNELLRLLCQIAEGLAFLHGEHVVHGDIKGENILVDDYRNALLCDFGLSVFSNATNGHQSIPGGSARFQAPELLEPELIGGLVSKRTAEADVYAFAHLTVQAYTLHPPFHKEVNESTLMLKVLRRIRPERPGADACHGRQIPDALWKLVTECWHHDVQPRPTIADTYSRLLSVRDSL